MRKDAHCEKSLQTKITMCRQKHTRKRAACFNLALLINVAEPAQNHEKMLPRLHTNDKQIPSLTHVELVDSVAGEGRDRLSDSAQTMFEIGDEMALRSREDFDLRPRSVRRSDAFHETMKLSQACKSIADESANIMSGAARIQSACRTRRARWGARSMRVWRDGQQREWRDRQRSTSIKLAVYRRPYGGPIS